MPYSDNGSGARESVFGASLMLSFIHLVFLSESFFTVDPIGGSN